MKFTHPGKYAQLDDALSLLDHSELRQLALQTRSPLIRDHLARVVSHNSLSFADLLKTSLSDPSQPLLHPRAAILLARIVATQRLLPDDSDHALTIFECVLRIYGTRVLEQDDRLVYVDLLDRAGRAEDVRTALHTLELTDKIPVEAGILLSNASYSCDGPGTPSWLEHFNDMLGLDDLAPLSLSPGTAAVLDRLESTSPAAGVDGPLVTIIVPTWRPGPWLWTAVRSLSQQTYGNLEILVMDDGSGPEYAPQLDRLCSLDSRIQVIRCRENRGTYAVRNLAIREYSHGDYVTIQDDDDWSHPQRLERQVRFSQSKGLSLGIARAARVTDDLRFVRRGATFARPGYPTTLVTRGTFLDLGYWDPVRRNSDSEFISRVKRAGKPMEHLGRAPLLLQRHRSGSLSSAEVWEGYMDQARRWQEWLSSDWHRRMQLAGKRTYMGSGTALPRPYAAPVGLTRTQQAPATQVDAIVVADYGVHNPAEGALLRTANILLAAGKTIGLLHVDGLRPLPTAISADVAKLTRRQGITLNSWGERTVARTVHLFETEGLTLCESVESKIEANQVIIHGPKNAITTLVVTLFRLNDSQQIEYGHSSDLLTGEI